MSAATPGQWEPVIGLEIHVQLATRSKIFSGASTAYGAAPNTQACAVDLGLPGVLPVLNGEAVRMAVMFGLAIGAEIAPRSVFARKNYFYPDLPKGYQISQYEEPIARGGEVAIDAGEGGARAIRVTRAHLEEDAGKSLHDAFQGLTGIDLNRAGTPLIEIVSEPDMRSAAQAAAYMRKVYAIVTWLGICDGNLQEGSFRCDANVSVRRRGESALGTRTEIKNLNSFRFVERAIRYEIERQIEVLESGGSVVQETRLYDDARDETRGMRGKEEAEDYRYFPDPDLLPVELAPGYVEQIRESLPELPDARRARFAAEYGLGAEEAGQLTASRATADYFEAAAAAAPGAARAIANWIVGDLAARLNREDSSIADAPVTAVMLGGLVNRIEDGTISGKIAKEVFDAMWRGEGDADEVIESRGLRQLSDSAAIERLVAEVVAANPDQVAQYRAGREKVLGFFVGRVMKATGGKANPQQVNEILRRHLASD
ncbi:MAG: Asp-tRNA(Asn)/Glu-tRNA(Gln) amidotransferase subunit GatB [Gammaproteobacteria bacterium]|nr:Asp-tRNA(Asn)/Glu-tRNA(Gln) amidotransferase subunit GatB [Gammaproteobacteria bacterium]